MAVHCKTNAACPLHVMDELMCKYAIHEINGPLLGGLLTFLKTHPGGCHKGCLLGRQVDTAAPCHALVIGARRRPAEALLQLVRRQTTPSGLKIRKGRKREKRIEKKRREGFCY